MSTELKWHVVYVMSRQEKKVAKRMADQQIECYLPIAKRLSKWSDRKKWVDFPMFNGYVFVRPTLFQKDAVVQTIGVVGYLKLSGQHAVVQDKEIYIIRTIEKEGYFAETILNPGDFEEGERVLIVEGPLKGQKVDLVRKNNERIFLISFDTLGQSIKVNVPYEFLQKVKETG
ncbi:MAG: transcriptional antiterminator NusG [Bacteroidia bacterium]|jgi:transcriptional antiterminator NusG